MIEIDSTLHYEVFGVDTTIRLRILGLHWTQVLTSLEDLLTSLEELLTNSIWGFDLGLDPGYTTCRRKSSPETQR